jgi:hypothetical protein
MKIDKVQIGLVSVVLVFGVLTLLYWNFIRDTIVLPIYYLLWISSHILKSIPQEAYLAFLIFASIIISINTVQSIRVKQITRSPGGNQPQVHTRYLHWRRLCANLYYNWFSRNQFALEARQLLLAILAYQAEIDTSEVEAMVRDGTLCVPDSIRNLVQDKAIQDPRPTTNSTKKAILRLRRAFLRVDSQNDPQIDSQVVEIVSFIEHCLEINHVGNRPHS